MISQPITGFVLAGGQSRRMGRDKAVIEWGRETLLTHAVKRMSEAFLEVVVLGGSRSEGFSSLPDEFPNRGPLGGIHSALRHSETDWNFFLAVDMPLVPTTLVRFIAAKCEPSHLAVVPRLTISELNASSSEGKSPSTHSLHTEHVFQPL